MLDKGESKRVTIKIRDYALRLTDCGNRPVELTIIADICIGFDCNADMRVEYSLYFSALPKIKHRAL